MPICPRCGKVLTSDQALTYHLNKKFRCGSWRCVKCQLSCSTKLDLQVHEMSCLSQQTTQVSTDKIVSPMDIVYNEARIAILELNDDKIITTASPQSKHVLGVNHIEGKTVDYVCNLNMTKKMHMLSSNVAVFY